MPNKFRGYESLEEQLALCGSNCEPCRFEAGVLSALPPTFTELGEFWWCCSSLSLPFEVDYS